MTITELKAKKLIPAVRVDNHFKSNDERQAEFEKMLFSEGWIIEGMQTDYRGGIYYRCHKNTPEKHQYYATAESEKRVIEIALKQLKRKGYSSIGYFRQGDFIIFETAETQKGFFCSLNRPEMNLHKIPGMLKIRSKDYVFEFTDADGKKHELYGVPIKKEMLTENGLHYENENGVNIDYIIM
jgi:hypothetical protein